MFSQTFTDSDKELFQNSKPFSHLIKDDFLEKDFVVKLQSEILNIPDEKWDRYNNPFEDKFTLRNKWEMPIFLHSLFEELQTEEFVKKLENLSGKKLFLDRHRHFWGVHKFHNGDKLDLHLDAEMHPQTLQKKQLTLGIYLTTENWKPENNGNIELWESDDGGNLTKCFKSIEPRFNRFIIFDNSEKSWHGAPEKIVCDESQKRIFFTMSYMSGEKVNYKNCRQRAFFAERPHDNWTQEKINLRNLRCDPLRFSEAYRTTI